MSIGKQRDHCGDTRTKRQSHLRMVESQDIGNGLGKKKTPDRTSESFDSQIQRLVRELHECDLILNRWAVDRVCPDWDQARFDAVYRRWWAIFYYVVQLPASTKQGRQAKASLLPLIVRDWGKPDEPLSMLALSVSKDIVKDSLQ